MILYMILQIYGIKSELSYIISFLVLTFIKYNYSYDNSVKISFDPVIL